MENMLLFLLGAGIGGGFAWLHVRGRKRLFGDVVEAKAEVYREMQWVVDNTPVQRFLVFRTSNGGGKPNVGTQVYSTAIFERVHYPFEPKMQELSRVPLDEHYLGLLREARSEKFIFVDAEKVPMNSMIGGIYHENGVRMAIWAVILETPEAMYYASLAADGVMWGEMVGSEHLWKYERAIKNISKIFKQHHF